jgi:muramidase (phage lysozyme)
MQTTMSDMVNKFDPMNLTSGLFGIDYIQNEESPAINKLNPIQTQTSIGRIEQQTPAINKLNPIQTQTSIGRIEQQTPAINKLKLGKVDTGLYTTVSSGTFQRIRPGDGAATIATKQYSLFEKINIDNKKKLELQNDFEKEKQEETKRMYEDLLKNDKSDVGESKKEYKKITKEETPRIPKISKVSSFKKPKINLKRTALVTGGVVAGAVGVNALMSSDETKPKDTTTPIKDTTSSKIGTKPTASQVKQSTPVATEGIAKILEKGESKSYDQLVIPKSGDLTGKFNKKSITEMSVKEVRELQSKMSNSKKFPSNAVGKYQIIGTTLQEAINKGFIKESDKFSPENQDKIFKQYLVGAKRSAISEFISGKSDDIENAQIELAKEFASVGVPKDMMGYKRKVKKGESFYADVAGNQASITPEQSAAALQYDRMVQTGKTKPDVKEAKEEITTPKESLSMNESSIKSSGDKISSVSSENKQAKLQSKTNVASINPVTNVMGTPPKKQIISQGTLSDLPMFVALTTPSSQFMGTNR